MLRIGKSQMKSLAAAQRRSFIRRMADHLSAEFTGCRELRRIDLEGKIDEGITEANQNGIDLEPDVRSYLEILAEFDWNLLDQTEATAILSPTGISGTDKVDRLSDWATFALR